MQLPDDIFFPSVVAHLWTPHSGRTSLPSSSASLKVEKTTRDFLGGWNAQGSDMCFRIARLRKFTVQKAVVNAVPSQEGFDPAFELEALREFVDFLDSTQLTREIKTSLVRAVEPRPRLSQPQASLSVQEPDAEDVQGVVPHVEEEFEVQVAEPVKTKRGRHAQIRTAELGSDPRAKRAQLRSTMRSGFYLCFSGKKNVRTLHRLGSCYALPSVDYLRYEYYLGSSVPPVASFDCL